MLKNYFKIAYRTLLKHKLFTFLNIFGLTLSLVSCLLIYRFVSYHLSFDNFHTDGDRIYRVVTVNEHPTGKEYEAETPYPLGEAIKNEFPDIKKVARIHAETENVIKADEEKFKETAIVFGNADFLEVFNFSIKKGNSAQGLNEPNKVFLTEKTAQKYFGAQEALGKVITFGNGLELTVEGILHDPPENTHISMNMLISYPTLKEHYRGYGFDIEKWGVVLAGYTYVLLPEGLSTQELESNLAGLVEKYYSRETAEKKKFQLQALSALHVSKEFTGGDLKPVVNPDYLKIFSLVGIFILLIACINFINLATAQSLKRAKEVGIRKVIGAGRKQLIGQFMGEVTLIVSMAILLSYGLAEVFGGYLARFMEVTAGFSGGIRDIYFLLAILIGVSLLSGMYPAFVISAYAPLASLKNKIRGGNPASNYLRRGLVVVQFSISVALITGTIVIAQQLDFFKSKDLGFRKDAVVIVEIPEPEKVDVDVFRSQLLSHSFIGNISFNLGAPTSINNISTSMQPTSLDNNMEYQVALKLIDKAYLETFDLKLKAGRWFTRGEEEHLSDTDIPQKEKQYKFVVNETLAKTLGFSPVEAILGTSIKIGLGAIQGEVIGITKDYNIRSLHDEVEPVIMFPMPSFYYQAAFTIQQGRLSEGIAEMEALWSKTFPDAIFEYEFLDQQIAELYKGEQKTSVLFKIFSGIAIAIGCMGLFGLSAFMTTQRTKEIGVRKVLGASLPDIIKLLSTEVIVLVGVANLIAIPIAWVSLNKWLENFAYRITIGPEIFVLAAIIAALVALLTVSYQTIKAAVANPVESLKSE